jgi:3'-phosphoadenosine 5'-phosphosulfate sulfotransferase (PAPS reductase)/FAD synthetase
MENKILEWALHSHTAQYKKAVSTAKKVINLAAASGVRYVCQWSGGKDSTAMTHLVKQLMPDVPILTQFDDCDWGDKKPYIDRVSQSFGWNVVSVYPDFSVFEMMIKNHPGYNSVCRQQHSITIESFIKPLENKTKELGCTGRFLGLRNEESIGRRMNYRKRGAIYTTKKGWSVCNPLYSWTVMDVFAYLVSNKIEINPCYLKNKFRQPEHIRLAWAMPTNSVDMLGDIAHIKHYYPELFCRLREAGLSS